MAVRVGPLNVLGGAGGPGSTVASFSDNFTRANTTDWGPNWAVNNFETGANVCNIFPAINANLGRMQQNGAGSPYILLTPVPMLWMLAQPSQKSHFSSCAWQAVSNTTSDFYVAVNVSLNVFATANPTGFYAIQRANSTGGLSIQKVIFNGSMSAPPGFTTLSTLSGATSVSGDVLRLEARISGSTWTLTALKNGVSLGSITDSSLTYAGMPGLSAVTTANGVTQDVATYSCGLL